MMIQKPAVEVLRADPYEEMLRRIERIGRVCYKSEDKIEDGSAEKFIRGIIRRGHESVIEHESLTVKFICDRGVTHEIVRHRLAAYCQESTRYCNYSQGKHGGEITFIKPLYLAENTAGYDFWKDSCAVAESTYFDMLEFGCSPQEARAVLPNSLKTEVVMTANLREWRHFFRLRTAPAAHPQMREVTIPLLRRMRELVPVVFDDIELEAER